jgi:S1-C subfamily serine protease
MNWIRIGAVLAALSLASYAQAQPPEALLGGPLPTVAGGKPKGSRLPAPSPRSPEARGAAQRYGKALGALQAEGRANTRGAKETNVYRKASPAVVLVVTKAATGSGVLVGSDGKIVTNLHVVGDAAEVGVIFKPAVEGAQVEEADLRRARVIRRDEVADLALIQVAEVPAGVTPLELGDSTAVPVGADVHAIGHPTGETWTYTKGIVSQVRRAYAWEIGDGVAHEATVIQTQTPINPGNSGGPLLDDNLKVVGINSFKGEGEGMNYAVSAEDVKTFLARSGDRTAPGGKARPVSDKPCGKTESLSEEYVREDKVTRVAMDETCDGRPDYVALIPDDKREPVVMAYDDDGDGEIDTVLFDKDWDGQPETGLYDTNGDGKPDLRGRFRKGEAEPYRYDRIRD